MIDVGLHDAQHLVVDHVGVTQLHELVAFRLERSKPQPMLDVAYRIDVTPAFRVRRLPLNAMLVFCDERIRIPRMDACRRVDVARIVYTRIEARTHDSEDTSHPESLGREIRGVRREEGDDGPQRER